MAAAWLAFFDGLLALVLIATGMLFAYLQLVAPFVGFQMFAFGFLLSILGALIGLLAVFLTRKPERRAGRQRALVGLVICLAIAVPIFSMLARGAKHPINDITTDVDNPPEFVFALTLPQNQGRDLKYDKAKYAARQQASEGIIAPLKERIEPTAAFARVLDVAQKVPTWKVTYSDPAKNTLEAVATSKLFHFHDDVIIQIRPTPAGESLIEMRSKSRDGIGDFGVNARRIHRFFDRIALSRGPSANEEMP